MLKMFEFNSVHFDIFQTVHKGNIHAVYASHDDHRLRFIERSMHTLLCTRLVLKRDTYLCDTDQIQIIAG